MTNLPTIPENEHLPTSILSFEARARDFAKSAKADATRRAYASDFQTFSAWCRGRGANSLPAEPATVLAFLIDSSELVKVATLQRRLVALREMHRAAGLELDLSSVAFRDTWRGIRREKGAPPAKKAALVTSELRRALAALPDTLLGVRDRALLLVGFAAALRRSELIGLHVVPSAGASHVQTTPDGLIIHLARTKTDQLAAGAAVAIPYGSNPETCPVRAYARWIEAAGISEGPAFRSIDRHANLSIAALSDKAVGLVVKRTIEVSALAAGATAEEARAKAALFGGHSLRAGLATSAAANDAPGHSIQRQLRHKKFETTAGYIRQGQLFKQNAAGMAGL